MTTHQARRRLKRIRRAIRKDRMAPQDRELLAFFQALNRSEPQKEKT